MKNSTKFLITVLFGLLSCNSAEDPNTPTEPLQPTVVTANRSGNYTLFQDGVGRPYILHVPNGVNENSSLVFFLHGYQGDARAYQSFLGLDAVADEHNFIVCYPQGSNDFQGTPHWNAGLRISNVDDVGFLVALANKIVADNNLDPSRVFTSGLSNGGFMSYTLMCEAPETFRAMASIIGTMSGDTYNTCPYDRPKPILQLSGLDDKIVPIDGSMTTSGGWGGAPHMDDIINKWCEVNACNVSFTEEIGLDTDVIRYSTEDGLSNIWYYKISNFGHEWPTEINSARLNGAELIWEFFDQYN